MVPDSKPERIANGRICLGKDIFNKEEDTEDQTLQKCLFRFIFGILYMFYIRYSQTLFFILIAELWLV